MSLSGETPKPPVPGYHSRIIATFWGGDIDKKAGFSILRHIAVKSIGRLICRIYGYVNSEGGLVPFVDIVFPCRSSIP